jgi:hypothetical protein
MKSATETKDNATVLETGMDQVLKLLVMKDLPPF